MSFVEAALLGIAQGLVEWLPVSSEGVVATVHSLVFGSSLQEAVVFSLWLHLGTGISALVAFRREVVEVIGAAARNPLQPTPMLVFLIIATGVSAPLGFLLLTGLPQFSDRIGALAMAAVGGLMLVTGATLLRRPERGTRIRDNVTWHDGILTGVAQGLAALPGLSRSGLTVSALLGRGVDRREALTLSFLLSVPVSLGAGLYAALKSNFHASPEALLALAMAAVTGFVTVKVLVGLAHRVNFGWFVIIVGASIVAGGLWQGLA